MRCSRQRSPITSDIESAGTGQPDTHSLPINHDTRKQTMALMTTTIGAYPKPGYVTLPDWFQSDHGPDAARPTVGWAEAMEALFQLRPSGPKTLEQLNAGLTTDVLDPDEFASYIVRHQDKVKEPGERLAKR